MDKSFCKDACPCQEKLDENKEVDNQNSKEHNRQPVDWKSRSESNGPQPCQYQAGTVVTGDHTTNGSSDRKTHVAASVAATNSHEETQDIVNTRFTSSATPNTSEREEGEVSSDDEADEQRAFPRSVSKEHLAATGQTLEERYGKPSLPKRPRSISPPQSSKTRSQLARWNRVRNTAGSAWGPQQDENHPDFGSDATSRLPETPHWQQGSRPRPILTTSLLRASYIPGPESLFTPAERPAYNDGHHSWHGRSVPVQSYRSQAPPIQPPPPVPLFDGTPTAAHPAAQPVAAPYPGYSSPLVVFQNDHQQSWVPSYPGTLGQLQANSQPQPPRKLQRGVIQWLKSIRELHNILPLGIPLPVLDHAVVVWSVSDDGRTVEFLATTSFQNGLTRKAKFDDNAKLRRLYVPIRPAPPHPDTKMQLSLVGSAGLPRATWVSTSRFAASVEVVRDDRSAGPGGRRLSPESWDSLVQYMAQLERETPGVTTYTPRQPDRRSSWSS